MDRNQPTQQQVEERLDAQRPSEVVSFHKDHLTDIDFDERHLTDCDFRRVTFDRCTFRSVVFRRCDFYGAQFRDSNLLVDARFVTVSLNLCSLEGTQGFTYANVATSSKRRCGFGLDREAGLIQQASVQEYTEFLNRVKEEAKVTLERALDKRLSDAADTYRYFAGVWTSQGALADAAASYAAAQRLDRRNNSPFFRMCEWARRP